MVRLTEFNHIEKEPKLDYDLMDDVYFYMMNDDDFYRKNYYPTMNKCKQTGDNESVMPLIDSCIKEYCMKYKIPKLKNCRKLAKLAKLPKYEKLVHKSDKNLDKNLNFLKN